MSISELKANLSRYIRDVRRGAEVQVLDRGVPVARLVAVEPGAGKDSHRQELIRAGVLRPGSGDASAVLETPPLQGVQGLQQALEEERMDRE